MTEATAERPTRFHELAGRARGAGRALGGRQGVRIGVAVLLLALPWLLLWWDKYQELYNLNSAGFNMLVILSLVLLTGWVGQISLAHAALVGVGTYTAANVSQDWGWAFPLQLVAAGGAGGLLALVLGIPSLRLKGLYLAVATLAFQWAAEGSIFQWNWFTGGYEGAGSRPITVPGLGVNLDGGRMSFRDEQQWLYYVVLGMVVAAVLLLANLRDTKTGRAFVAIRDSEMAAQSLGIDVIRYKLTAFVMSGCLAGAAGAILANQIERVSTETFGFSKSIGFVVFAIIGGIHSLAGAAIAGLAFMFGEVVQSNVRALQGYLGVFAGALVIVTLLDNPDGLVALPQRLRGRIEHLRVARQLKRERGMTEGTFASPVHDDADEADAADSAEADQSYGIFDGIAAPPDRKQPAGGRRARTEPVLAAAGITVRFGGVTANDQVDLEVRSGEIVGLIGPNGAGKTTFFNAVSGYVAPQGGQVSALGTDITDMAVHRRAGLGIGRTFQAMRLLPKLTVRENLLIATHMANESGLWSGLLLTGRARREEAAARQHVDEVIERMRLGRVAGERVSDLPFGVLRMVELSRALVARPRLLLLDEPASGLDTAETDAFADILLTIREEIDISMLLIEHDMSLVMAVSDYVYVLDFGSLLCEGTPDQVRTNQDVIAAYLGESDADLVPDGGGEAAPATTEGDPVAVR